MTPLGGSPVAGSRRPTAGPSADPLVVPRGAGGTGPPSRGPRDVARSSAPRRAGPRVGPQVGTPVGTAGAGMTVGSTSGWSPKMTIRRGPRRTRRGERRGSAASRPRVRCTSWPNWPGPPCCYFFIFPSGVSRTKGRGWTPLVQQKCAHIPSEGKKNSSIERQANQATDRAGSGSKSLPLQDKLRTCGLIGSELMGNRVRSSEPGADPDHRPEEYRRWLTRG